MTDYLRNYIASQKQTLEAIDIDKVSEIIALFRQALNSGSNIFVFGNGGSGASASHFVTDLGKGASDKTHKRFRCQCLNDNASWITAIANDYSYEEIFSRQLMNLATRGDLVFTMSVSGDSPNLVRAVEWAGKNGLHSIALVGGKRGRLATMADTVLVVDNTHYGRVEDTHMGICHMIAFAFMEISSLQNP